MSKFDFFYRKLILSQFFVRGWGKPEYLNKIVSYRRSYVGDREKCLKLVPNNTKIIIDQEWKYDDHILVAGHFESPFVNYLGDFMPDEIKPAKFQMLIPKKWNTNDCYNKTTLKPVCIHLAGTGDHFFWRRKALLAKPLLNEHSIASIILENPFYGYRKPKEQTRSSLQYVADLYMMGGMLVTESIVLMRWCEKLGYGPFVLTGLSMGGHMASLAATAWPKPVALVPCLSWTTASTVFTRGVMSAAIPWNLLEEQYYANKAYQNLKEKLMDQNIRLYNNDEYEIQTVNGVPYLNLLRENSNFLANYNIKAQLNNEILNFMQLLMDECTHLLNFDKPFDASLVYVLTAKNDAYILRDGVHHFHSIWPGSQIEYLDQGHVSAFLFAQNNYRQRIKKMLDVLIDKYYKK